MKRRFIAKKRVRVTFIKVFLWLFVVALALVVTFNTLLKTSLDGMLGDADLQSNLFEIGTNQKKFLSFDLLDPRDLFKLGLNYKIDYEPAVTVDDLTLMTKHENSPNPLIYIYSTHDTEEYDSTLSEVYNIKYKVTIGGYILSDYLKDLGIPSYVEKESMVTYLRNNDYNYNHSYYASKYYIEKRKAEFSSIKMMIDLHRDGIPRSASVATIDGKSYAKIYFIVAVDYPGYEKNVALAEKLNSLLPKGLSRGVSKGNGVGANGVFNQDLLDKALLLEIGGTGNTIEEVNNTMEVLAKAIFKLVKEEKIDG